MKRNNHTRNQREAKPKPENERHREKERKRILLERFEDEKKYEGIGERVLDFMPDQKKTEREREEKNW